MKGSIGLFPLQTTSLGWANHPLEKITNIVGIVGLINIPIIKFSVAWWNTLHQPASITLTAAPTIHSSMLAPLLIMFFSFCILSLIIFLIRYKYEIINFRVNKK